MKRILYAIAICTCLFFLYDLKQDWNRYEAEKQAYHAMMKEQSAKAMRIEGSLGPSKVVVDIEQATPWDLVFKAVFSVLATALGLALIKKYVR